MDTPLRSHGGWRVPRRTRLVTAQETVTIHESHIQSITDECQQHRRRVDVLTAQLQKAEQNLTTLRDRLASMSHEKDTCEQEGRDHQHELQQLRTQLLDEREEAAQKLQQQQQRALLREKELQNEVRECVRSGQRDSMKRSAECSATVHLSWQRALFGRN